MVSPALWRARAWCALLPLLSGGLTLFAIFAVRESIEPPFGYAADVYTEPAYWVLQGLAFAVCVGMAARRTGLARARPKPAALALAWGPLFGVSVGLVAPSLEQVIFCAPRPQAWSAPRGLIDERVVLAAIGTLGPGLVSALVLWWMTGSRRVGLWSAVAGAGAALMYFPVVGGHWLWDAPVIGWNLVIGGILGRYTLEEARRQNKGICPWCRYSLAGLPEGTLCPECGGDREEGWWRGEARRGTYREVWHGAARKGGTFWPPSLRRHAIRAGFTEQSELGQLASNPRSPAFPHALAGVPQRAKPCTVGTLWPARG